MSLLIDVIIVTRNRSKYLQRCIESIQNQSYKKFKITVIDNNSNDDTREILSLYTQDLRKIFLDNNLGCPGARNVGIYNTDGDVLFFVDDDGALEPNVLEVVNATMEKDKNLAAVVCAIRENDRWLIREEESESKNTVYLSIFLGQCALRRSAIDAVGAYPEDFIYGGEEVDLSLRLLANDYQILFAPNAVTHHYKAESGRFFGQNILREKNLLSVYIRYAPMPLFFFLVLDKSIDYFRECVRSNSFIKEMIRYPGFFFKTIRKRTPIDWHIFALQDVLNTMSIQTTEEYQQAKLYFPNVWYFTVIKVRNKINKAN